MSVRPTRSGARDWMMPSMSGLEFYVKFRDWAVDIFLFSSPQNLPKMKSPSLEMGADDFLTNLSTRELPARIIAAGRILTMQRELEEKNKFISSR